MDLKQFQQNPSGRLVKAFHEGKEYWAFVPDSLPPNLPPNLALNLGLSKVLSSADRALGELSGLGRVLPNPHLLIGPFIRREAVLSSRIEGTQTGIADLYAYEAAQLPLPGIKPSAPDADAREVLNYVRALEYGLERVKTLPISLRLFRELHERLMSGVRGEDANPGEFRRTQNYIGARHSAIQDARFVPPPISEMHESLNSLEEYIHNENDPYPPLVRLAFIHYQFETIHPFVDGNGRIGRLLISLLLVDWELLPLPLLYLSAFFERHRDTYNDLLLAVSTRSAWHEWVSFFLHGVAEQARDAVQRAKRLLDLQVAWRDRLMQERASPSALRLMEELFSSPILTIPLAQDILGTTYPTAQHSVQRLVDAGILRPETGTSYRRHFLAEDILRIIGWEA